MNFHHSGADRGRRFPWFTNGHIKTTKLTFEDSEPTDPLARPHSESTRMAPGGGEPPQEAVDAVAYFNEAWTPYHAVLATCRRLVDAGYEVRRRGPRNDRRALPDDALAPRCPSLKPAPHHSRS